MGYLCSVYIWVFFAQHAFVVFGQDAARADITLSNFHLRMGPPLSGRDNRTRVKSYNQEEPMADKPITRDQLAQLLNEDLSREYQAIIAYVVYSQVLKARSI